MRWVRCIVVGALALLLGCSDSSHPCEASGPQTELSVGGIRFVERSMAAFESAPPNDAEIFAEVAITESADACTDGGPNPDSDVLDFQINRAKVGTFCVADPSAAKPGCAWAFVLGPTLPDGGRAASAVAQKGTVTLTAIDPMHVAGTYDLGFATGEYVAGSFDAPTCNVGTCSQ